MIDYDNWAEIFSSIRRHKLRTFLTALSVWWGIFMLVILIGLGNGLQNSVQHNFRDDAVNSLWIWPGRTTMPYKGLPVGRSIQLTNEDYELIRNQVEGIDHITARFYLRGEFTVQYKKKVLSYSVRCVHPDHQILENTVMTSGRFINEKDLKEFRKICVIGEVIAEDVFGKEEDPIGQFLTIKGVEYKIVGVFHDSGSRREMENIYLPISTAQRVESANGRINQLMMTMGDLPLNETLKVEQNVRAQLASQHNFDINDRQAIYLNNHAEDYQEFQTVFIFIKGFLWFVGIGSIIAGVIGVSNIMLIVVKDRTKEIGIRKALGASPNSILKMIMQESVFLTAIAGYIGMISGFILIYGINYLLVVNEVELEFFRNPEVDFKTIVYALILLVVSGALAGLIPALQAVRIKPVVAMKS